MSDSAPRGQGGRTPRIQGLETEYAIVWEPRDSERRPDGILVFSALAGAVVARVKALSAKHRKAGYFLENGGFLHYEGRPDALSHGLVEYSTPECASAKELSLHAKAGERLLAEALDEAERTLEAEGYAGSIILGRNSRDAFGNIYGSHENYLVSDPIPVLLWLLAAAMLATFVATLLPFVVVAVATLVASLVTYYASYATILCTGLLVVLLVQLCPPLHGRAAVASLRLDQTLESYEAFVREPLWRLYGVFFHYLFMPFARLLSGILRLFVFRDVRRHLPTFLATRLVFTGTGHVARAPGGPIFWVSEKATAIGHVARLYWDDVRPMIDLKNFVFERRSVLAPEKRLQIMMSDSNMNEHADYLKFGTTALVLSAIRAGAIPAHLRAVDPVAAMHAVALDPTLAVRIPMVDGRSLTALEVQRELLGCCELHVKSQPAVSIADAEVLRAWRQLLADLERDPASAADRVDWILKRRIVEEALGDEVTLEELAPWRDIVLSAERAGVELRGDGCDVDRLRAMLPRNEMQRLVAGIRFARLDERKLHERAEQIYRAKKVDLKYHDIRPGRGYFARCRAAGMTRTLHADAEVADAMRTPPRRTRAHVRGRFVKRHHHDPRGRVSWTFGKARRVRVRFPAADQSGEGST